MRIANRVVTLLATVAGWSLALAGPALPPALADEGFRIDNRVFASDASDPASQSTTIFMSDAVYDFLEKPSETLVLEKQRAEFVLLDNTRRVAARTRTEDVLRFTEEMRRNLSKRKEASLAVLAHPKLDENFDAAKGVLELSCPWLSYRVVTLSVPPDSTMPRAFREFSDWYCRLRPMIDPSGAPPFARLVLNAALESHNVLPKEVTLTYVPKIGAQSKRETVRSEHRLVGKLTEADTRRVVEAQQAMVNYNSVSLAKYRKAEK